MEENKNLNEVAEAVEAVDTSEMDQEDLKKKVGDFLTQERGKAMILGYKVACRTILQLIAKWRQSGCSKREYERIFKMLEEFCSKALNTNNEGDENLNTKE